MMPKRILLVDDDDICHFLHSKLIERLCAACHIETASNGADALIKLQQNDTLANSQPDVILLDLNMPVMDGFEFMERFEEMEIPGKDKINVVVVSSSVRQEDVVRASALGVSEFFSKPLSERDAETILKQ